MRLEGVTMNFLWALKRNSLEDFDLFKFISYAFPCNKTINFMIILQPLSSHDTRDRGHVFCRTATKIASHYSEMKTSNSITSSS
jgi:hypothetical protein